MIVTTQVIWYGTPDESAALVEAVSHNCTCEFALMGERITTCPPHNALVTSQRFLNGLLYARRMSEKLLEEEWAPTQPEVED